MMATRRNADADLRALERAAAGGDMHAIVKLDVWRHRTGQPSELGWLVENGLDHDVAHAPDYFPAPGALANRESRRQSDAIDAIALAAVGSARVYFWSASGDGWDSGYRYLPNGEIETRVSGPYARHFSCRDNRDHGQWLACMQTIADALESAGHRVFWVERSDAIRSAFVPLDADRIRLASALADEYASIVREARGGRMRRNVDESLRDLERRWRATGDQQDLRRWRAGLNRAGQAPPGEVFYRELFRRAAGHMRTAADRLERAASNVSGNAFNGADLIEWSCLAYAAASRSAAARLSRSRPPAVSTSAFRDTTSPPFREYWQDAMADASTHVSHAEGLLRDVAFDMERNEDKEAAGRVWPAVRWLSDLRSAISHTRDPHGGHDRRSWWDRHGATRGLSPDAWWSRHGDPIPAISGPPPTRRNSDEELRRRQREASRTPHDAGARRSFLVAELRAGRIPAAYVRLAALLGDADAEEVSGVARDPDLVVGFSSFEGLERWVQALLRASTAPARPEAWLAASEALEIILMERPDLDSSGRSELHDAARGLHADMSHVRPEVLRVLAGAAPNRSLIENLSRRAASVVAMFVNEDDIVTPDGLEALPRAAREAHYLLRNLMRPARRPSTTITNTIEESVRVISLGDTPRMSDWRDASDRIRGGMLRSLLGRRPARSL